MKSDRFLPAFVPAILTLLICESLAGQQSVVNASRSGPAAGQVASHAGADSQHVAMPDSVISVGSAAAAPLSPAAALVSASRVTAVEPLMQPPAPPQQGRRPGAQAMNPSISVIGNFLGTANFLDGLERNYDFGLEEAEFAFNAVVDPYASADFFIAAGRHAEPVLLPGGEPDGEEDEHGHEEEGLAFELEEAYVTLLTLPLHSQLKAGKFRAKFGKLNETHPHAYNFLDLPLLYQHFMGGEGLNDNGVSLRWLLPHDTFFQELTLQVLSGPAENFSFVRAENNRFLYLGHLKNYFDLNESTSLELGVLGMTGPNHSDGDRTDMFGADLTVKWKPLRRNRFQSFEWTSEFLLSRRREQNSAFATTETVSSIGWFSHARYQFRQRWYLGAMAEYAEFPAFDQFNRKAYSGILQFYATEFQKFELQARYNDGNFFDGFADFMLRAVFVIGSHGAHQY